MKRTVFYMLILLIVIFASSPLCPAETSTPDLKIGFLYVSLISDAGWTYSHDQGRKMIEKIPGVNVKFVESVDEGIQSEPILEFMAREKYNLIFATSYGYMDPVIKIAKMYPEVIFMHCSGYKRARNVGTYFGRMYQPRYLTGMVAGAMSKSNKLGMVAAYPIPEIIRGINAFTLGAQSINPKVEMTVVWTNTWYDPAKEKMAALTLIDQGVDVITQHQDSPAVQVVAQSKGIYSIGYNTDMRKFAPKSHLTAPVWNWEVVYRYTVEHIQAESWQSEDLWWGMEKGLVDIAPIAPMVPNATKDKVVATKRKMMEGKTFVFRGPIIDQKGKIRIAAKDRATDEQLRGMNWFVNGVIDEIK